MTESEIQRAYNAGDHRALRELAASLPDIQLELLAPATLEQLGLAASEAGDHALGAHLLAVLHRRYPLVLAVQANLGVALLRAGKLIDAQRHLSAAARSSPQDAVTALNLGLVEWQLGNLPSAAHSLRACLRLWPSCIEARLYLASCAVAQGEHMESWRLAKPLSAELQLELADRERLAALLLALDRVDEAEQLYRKLLAEVPQEAAFAINLAAICERSLRYIEADSILKTLPAGVRVTPRYALQRARVSAGLGTERSQWLPELLKAWQNVQSVSSAGLADLRLASELGFEVARALDLGGNHEGAHEAALRANTFSRDALRLAKGGQGAESAATAIGEAERDASVAKAQRGMGDAGAEQPIWLVGFPRSGTTLLDRILDAHPAFQIMEERPAVDTLLQAIDVARGKKRLDGGPVVELPTAELQAIYWQAVDDRVHRRPSTQLVDKNPLNLVHVHAMMAVFPQAKWIFAIRHPCDVVLSCFMQSFRFSNAERGFWSIEESAGIYAEVMGRWLDRRARLQPPCFDLRYEALVQDPSGVLQKLFGFLAVEWRPEVLDYHQNLAGSHIATPSYRQVNRPIYTSSVQRWKRYAPWFEQALPILEPLVLRLGYPSLFEAQPRAEN